MQKREFMNKIGEVDIDGYELIYALIKAYQIKNPEINQHTLPFDGKTLKSGLKFDMTKFPERLQNILAKFVELHENRTDV